MTSTPKPTPPRLSWPLRGLIAIAALAALLTFAFPLWIYEFDAPQYPEGLSMSIWSYKLGGKVDLINGLNHYVGFMELHESDFIEFRVLPALIILVAVSGLAVAVTGSLRGLVAWVSGFTLFGVVALIDFYRWLYAFGHTIDPMAIIDVEGYTPPMFGTSQFMNFVIRSHPGPSFYILVGSLLLGVVVLLGVWWRRPKSRAVREAARVRTAQT